LFHRLSDRKTYDGDDLGDPRSSIINSLSTLMMTAPGTRRAVVMR